MKRFFLAVLFVTAALITQGQDGVERKGRPDIPGDLLFEYGLTFSADESVPFKSFGTRSMNFYYIQSLRLGDSKLSFHPGIGIGLDKFKFDVDSLERPITIVDVADSSYYVPIEGLGVIKSFLMASYLDIPLELRYNTRPNDLKRSFTITLGAKVGFLLQGKSKYKYRLYDETHKVKEQHPYHLSPIRYGAYLRVGGGGVSAYLSYMITPLFKKNEGHLDMEPNMMSAGISFNLF